MRIGIIGCGNVGLNTARAFQVHGHEVICHDISATQLALASEYFGPAVFTSDMADLLSCKAIFECVPTEPFDESGQCDLAILEDVVRQVAAIETAPGYACEVFVQRSTCPPGTARNMAPILASTAYVVNPSFLAKDSQWEDSISPVRLAVGGPVGATRLVMSAYEGFTPESWYVSESMEAVELLKYTENVIDAVLISLWNEFLSLSDSIGISREAFIAMVNAATERPRFRTTFRAPGGAFGLHCLPKDIAALAWEAARAGVAVPTMCGAIETNANLANQGGVSEIPTSRLLKFVNGRLILGPDGLARLLPADISPA